jgi:hypothetical protein
MKCGKTIINNYLLKEDGTMCYMVVNYDWNDRYPEEFDSFDKAKSIFKQLRDPTYTLEFYDRYYNRKILLGKGKRSYNYKEKRYVKK